MFPTIELGPLVIPSNGLVIILGAWISLTVVEKAARRLRLDAESTYSLAAISLLSAFIGARLVFVLLHWSAYRQNLSGIFWPLTSGYNLWGGLIIGVAAALFYGRSKRVPWSETLDALAPGLITGLLFLSLADFLAGPGYGTESALPWAIDVFGIERHPVQIYEIMVAIAALAAWMLALPGRLFEGYLFLLSTAVYCAGRLFVDAYRANTWLTEGGFHLIQIVTLLILLLSLLLIVRAFPDTRTTALEGGNTSGGASG